MNRYADIIIDISHTQLDHPFTYRIPEKLSEEIRQRVGQSVAVCQESFKRFKGC